MKFGIAIPMITAVIVLAGCKSKEQQSAFVVDDSRAMHEAMVKNYWAEHTEGAILRGGAVYPYHFELNSSELNELGAYEVGVMARSGAHRALNVHLARGDASDTLYQARMNVLRDALIDGGADANMLAINDTRPGGEGMSSERVRFNAEREAAQMAPVYGAAAGNDTSN
jgi:hypothetical protein